MSMAGETAAAAAQALAAAAPAIDTVVRSDEELHKSKANAAWEELKCKNSTLAAKADLILRASYGRAKTENASSKPPPKKIPEWMISLGMAPKRKSSSESKPAESSKVETSEADRQDSARAAAAALAAIRSPAAASASKQPEAAAPQGAKANNAAKRKAEMQASSTAGLDSLLDQIGKKQKQNILDKSKQDWGEFKDEKGFSEELEAYKKSGDKYLEKVAFLQRADVREYEKERDARLAYQSKQRRQGVNYEEG